MNSFPNIESEADFDKHFQDRFWEEAARQICLRHHLPFSNIRRVESSDHIVFLIADILVLKIFRPFRRSFERETESLEFVQGKTDFVVPEIIVTGNFEAVKYILITQIGGLSATREDWLKLATIDQIEFVTKLSVGLKQFHTLETDQLKCDWPDFVQDRADTFVQRQISGGVNARIIEELPNFIDTYLGLIPKNGPAVFMHSDVHFGNLKVIISDGKWKIGGLFDFADSRRGFHEYDFLAVCLLIIQGQGEVQREFFKAYGYLGHEIDESMRKRLMMLTMLYETSDLRRYALRLRPEAVDYSLEELERSIWSFVE